MSAGNHIAPEPGSFVSGLELIARGLVWLAAIVLLFMVAITLLDVFLRVAFRDPLFWVYDIFELVSAVLLLGGALALAGGWDAGREGAAWAVVRLLFLLLLALPATGLLIYGFWSAIVQSIEYRELSAGLLAMPMWPSHLLLLIAGISLFLQIVAEIARCFIRLDAGQWPIRSGTGWSIHGLMRDAAAMQRQKQALDDIWS